MAVVPLRRQPIALHERVAAVMRELIALIGELAGDDRAVDHLLDAITSAARARDCIRRAEAQRRI
jgi:hypothetical protein